MLMGLDYLQSKGASVFIWSDEASSTVARNLSEKQRQRIQADIKNLKPVDFDEDAARHTISRNV